MDNNTSLMLIDNNASFEMDHVDASHNNPMALARPSTDDGLLLPQPGILPQEEEEVYGLGALHHRNHPPWLFQGLLQALQEIICLHHWPKARWN
ncbi:hypothetical protein Bca4012_099466 [Brassica carinata]|uniref:(rape) hypothetical protein n=1 Tax=Brassica napus TaxID=3708 RepID=A0A078FJE2_BRANA|nr:unnamed protein product [Brassica napus]CDY13316.1 BnaC06g14410D [Brassica napus]